MQTRRALFDALADAIEQHPDIGAERLVRNRSRDVADDDLPLVHVFWTADNKVAEQIGKARRELTFVAEIYAQGKDRDEQVEIFEKAVCSALLDPDPRHFDVIDIDGADAENDEENAWYEFCQLRLSFKVNYIAENRRRTQ